VLLLASMATVGLGWVKVKMLPFDNKSEFQVILNMPEGSSLEQTAAVAREMAAAIRMEPEVTDYQVYAGVASPYNFNGLVRHYFMRRGANVADIQVNLVGKHERTRRATTSPNASARRHRHRGALQFGPASPSPRCRPDRRCCKPSSPRSTARTKKAR
jgi:multidrug efflux pump subunit AcrB